MNFNKFTYAYSRHGIIGFFNVLFKFRLMPLTPFPEWSWALLTSPSRSSRLLMPGGCSRLLAVASGEFWRPLAAAGRHCLSRGSGGVLEPSLPRGRHQKAPQINFRGLRDRQRIQGPRPGGPKRNSQTVESPSKRTPTPRRGSGRGAWCSAPAFRTIFRRISCWRCGGVQKSRILGLRESL